MTGALHLIWFEWCWHGVSDGSKVIYDPCD